MGYKIFYALGILVQIVFAITFLVMHDYVMACFSGFFALVALGFYFVERKFGEEQ